MHALQASSSSTCVGTLTMSAYKTTKSKVNALQSIGNQQGCLLLAYAAETAAAKCCKSAELLVDRLQHLPDMSSTSTGHCWEGVLLVFDSCADRPVRGSL
jgi:hypothetical protein